ncbi:hypothetical protein [Shinella sp. M27]|uniref:hypothetical protein n=1 Tax=Shinella sp. M27 TaxID=3368614 RepID=UPI003BA0A4B4
MSIDTDWELKAIHWEREAKRLIAENSNLRNKVLLTEAALAPFRSGGDWGYIKALIVAGAPDPAIGKNLAKKITEDQAAIDACHSVPETGTVVPETAVDFGAIIADLEEAHGFAALSPGGRENIEYAIANLEEAWKTTYQNGFVDGEKHAGEYLVLRLGRMLDEAFRRMSQPKILGFDADGFPIDNPEYLPTGDTQVGVEFATQYLGADGSIVPKVYSIGVNTMTKVFTPAGLTNVSDLQAVFDAVEIALSSNEAASK